MAYKVILIEDAEADLDRFIRYLLFVKKSRQAAENLFQDFEETKKSLEMVAGSLRLCENPRLNELGYRRKMSTACGRFQLNISNSMGT